MDDDAGLPFTIDQLWIYPVKACAGMPLQSVRLGPHGLVGDRDWAVVDATGALSWQGAVPRLALVRPELTVNSLVLHGPGRGALDLPRHAPGTPCRVTAWNEQRRDVDTFFAHDAGDAAAGWLSDLTGEPLRLVRLADDARHRPAPNPLHLLTLVSLQSLNERLAVPVMIERFRPNLVIDADPRLPAFCEDLIDALQLPGAPTLAAAGPCVRCVVPNVDPADASVGDEPLASVKAISAERQPGGPVTFGSYLRPDAAGLLHVGMAGRAVLRF